MQLLEGQIEDLAAEKKEKEAIAEMAERRCKSLEDENTRLREENERLRDELRFLRTEVSMSTRVQHADGTLEAPINPVHDGGQSAVPW